VRFSQEVSEDSQLQLLERGDRTFVGTFDDRPYVDPFHGNITDLCPVGALTSYTYRFRARPWDIEQGGTVCTLCPSQCNVSLTVRDEEVKRVVARDNPDVDDGWLCDRGRYGFEMFAAEERVRGPRLRSGEVAWDEAIAKAAEALRAGADSAISPTGVGKNEQSASGVAAIVGDASNEEGYLVQRIMREALGSPHIDSRTSRGPSRDTLLRLAQPELSARVRDLDTADAILVIGSDPLHASPILDLRIRKAMRRNGAKLVLATDRPTTLDGGATVVTRYMPGGATEFLAGLVATLERAADFDPAIGGEKSAAGSQVDEIATTLKRARSVVVVWGERIGREGEGATTALLGLADALDLAGKDDSGLLEIPDVPNARGLREVGCLPDAGPGLSVPAVQAAGADGAATGRSTEEIREALESGELKTLILFGVDPLRDFPDTPAWQRALAAADHLIVFSTFENATTAMADVVFPLETHAEKDGTVTHPDGRLQRVRPSASSPGDIRPNWGVLAELSLALGHDTGITSQPSALAALTRAVPFYEGIDDSAIAGRGIRWQDRDAATALPVPRGDVGTGSPDTQRGAPGDHVEADTAARGVASGEPVPTSHPATSDPGSLVLGTYRDLWAGPITDLNPPLKFLRPQQRVELSLSDAERLELKAGDPVRVSQNGSSVEATVQIRERIEAGTCFLIEGTADDNANALLNGSPVNVTIEKAAAR
jgi:NADH-quinone oxidoreductase subunit G